MNRKWVASLLIIVAGEAIFMLPFVIPRLYRPLILEAWGVTNTEIGHAYAAYGVTAMVSYFLGGPLADRFHPRNLIAASLVATALGGGALIFFPSAFTLIWTYAFFGVSTILLMWGALIKTTHLAGGEERRSLAMGLMDGGRGLTAAAYGLGLVFIVDLLVPAFAAPADGVLALRWVYGVTMTLLLILALGIWFVLKDFEVVATDPRAMSWERIRLCLRRSDVWLLSIATLGAYCAYKAIDHFATYLTLGHGVGASRSSFLTSLLFWLRPLAAVVTGFWADRWRLVFDSGRLRLLFLLTLLGGMSFIFLAATGGLPLEIVLAAMIAAAALAYALRALYFSVFGDLRVPPELIGTTVGLVSFVGFLPDVFYGWITGLMIDSRPGAEGFSRAFIFTGACVIAGATAALILSWRSRRSV